MLKRLIISDFTVFAEAEFEFTPGLNVVIGTNGTGKSHVLKLGYAVLSTFNNQLKEWKEDFDFEERKQNSGRPLLNLRKSKHWTLDEKISGVFRPGLNGLQELIRRSSNDHRSVIEYGFDDFDIETGRFFINRDTTAEHSPGNSKSSVARLVNKFSAPVFIPAKEILTLGWMLSASRQFKIPMDETYLDLLTQLGGLSLQNPEPAAMAAITSLISVLGGEIEEQNGSFFLVHPKEDRMEMNLVAEGLRKFGTLQKLLSNGSLTPRATLFWDEPEANLNPALLQKLAAVLAELAQQGFQIILATHSLFLLKELHILSRQHQVTKPLPVRYFGLNAGGDGATVVTTVDSFDELPDIVALDVQLEQNGTFLDVLNGDDANV